MSDANTYLRPEYTPLFSQIQDYIAEALNSDPQISATGIKFYPEHILDIEFQIKENLGKQGTVGIVNTLKGTYGGHNGTTQAWDIEAEIDIFENPSIRRAQMKKMGLSSGTTADLIDWVSESMCGPTSPTYGKFCAVRQQLGEDRGILVGKSIMKTYAIADVSGIVSGDYGWRIPYALWSDLSALSGQVMELSDIVVSGIGGNYLPLSGGDISGDITFQPNNDIYWGTPDGYDGRINASTPGLTIYNDAEDQWRFKSSFMSDSEYDVLRRMDLSSVDVPTKLSELSNDVGFVVSADVVMRTNASPLTITVPYDYGLTIQTPNGTPLLETIDLNRTSIYSLSTGNIEIASDGYLAKYPGAGVDTTKLSAWNWITTGSTSIGNLLSSEHSAILGEVSEDFVSFNWLIQQGYTTSAQMNEALSNYLPLSGGQMEGGIRWDYGGMGGPTIYGPYNPQQLAFTTTYEPDAQKLIVLDFGRIEEEQGQRTIAFVEDIDAVLGDISALIHAT